MINIFRYFTILFFTMLFFVSVSPFILADDGTQNVQDDSPYEGIYISGGHPMGLRYATAGAVCIFVQDIPCAVLPTTDSLKSLDALATGAVDMAMVQSDWVHHAVDGSSRFKPFGANPDLRVLAVLGVETVLLAVRKSAGIQTLADLTGRSFAIGTEKTYRSLFGKALLKSAGIKQKSVTLIQQTADDSMQALCSGTVDASVFVVPTPNGMMDTLTAQCDVVFLSLDTHTIQKIQKSFKGVAVSIIPADTYWNQPNAVRSLGLYTTLVTTTSLDANKAQTIQNAIQNNLNTLRNMHPAFRVFSEDFVLYDVGIPYYTKPMQ